MFAIKSDIVWFFIFIHVSKCERRIQDGIKAKAEKPYVVYLVKAPVSKVGYDYWLCGGALVTSEFVVTSAACIKDVDYLYVIAGYNKYVTDDDIELDQCTSKMKKKVIYTCYPQGYELRYEQLDVWSLIDIGVAKVESPYDFNDQSYKTLCSYVPSVIPISYDAKYQEAGIDAVVFGWGHQFKWRKQEDRANHNQEKLNYAPVMIIDKKECKSHYAEYGQMRDVIDTYMICTLEGGSLDDFGERLEVSGDEAQIPLVNGCAKRKSLAFNPDEAIEDCEEDYQYDDTRKQIKKSNHSSNNSMIEIRNKNNGNKTRAEPNNTTVSNRAGLTNRSALINRTASINRIASINRTASFEKPFISNKTVVFNETVRDTRRYGICQNDHGGPLVTWVGSKEVLIGVASVFKVSETYKCTGPYLYTSTQCNGAFLDCILTKAKFNFRRSSDAGIVFNNSRRSFCKKSIDDERHPTIERHISWLYHPAGAADHEKHLNPGINHPDINERIPAMNEEVNESEKSVNLTNKMNPPNKRYPLNDKFSVNVNNAPNERYAANNKRTPNENNAPNIIENGALNINGNGALNINENAALNINENGVPNKKYVANYQFAPPMVASNKYRPYNIPALNSGTVSYNGPVPNNKAAQNNKRASNDKPAQNNWPALNYKSDQMNYNTPNKKPALNYGPVQKYGPAHKNGPAHNSGPAQNNGPIQNNGPAQNNRPAPNYRPEPNNKYATRKIEITQNKEGKLRMRPQFPIHI